MKSIRTLFLLLCVAAALIWWQYSHNLDPNTVAVQDTAASSQQPVKERTFKSEQHWLVDEIGRDITDMVWFAKNPGTFVSGALEFRAALPPGRGVQIEFSATSSTGTSKAAQTLAHHLWAAENYTPWVTRLMADWKITPPSLRTPVGEHLIQSLGAGEVASLQTGNRRVSTALSKEPLDVELHEQAALLLGTLGLRETAGQFSDIRRILCRMTAHLAVARAIRAEAGLCGQLAEIVQLSLINRQAEAMEKITQLPPRHWTWVHALKMRCTGDWRILSKPATAGLLEQMEYGRALAKSVDSGALLSFLQKTNLPAGRIWNRLVMEYGFSIQTGHVFVKDSLSEELRALAEDWKTWSGGDLKSDNMIKVVNEPPTRAVVKSGEGKQQIEVISWGTLANFHQRHICHSIQGTMHFCEKRGGCPSRPRNLTRR